MELASPESPENRKKIFVRADRAGSVVKVPSEDACSTVVDTCILHPSADDVSVSCGLCTNRIPPNKMYNMAVVSRVSTRVF